MNDEQEPTFLTYVYKGLKFSFRNNYIEVDDLRYGRVYELRIGELNTQPFTIIPVRKY